MNDVSTPIVDVTRVVKDYRGLRPLRLERLTLLPGEHIALVGMDEPSAEMMATLLTGAVLPDSGSVTVLGTATANLKDTDDWLALVERIGLVSDRAALLEMFTVMQNLALPFTLDVDPVPPAVQAQAEALAREVALPDLSWTQPVGSLDGAAKTRVRLGRALALNPQLLVLEHPTAVVERTAVPALAADIRSLTARRHLTTLTLTGDLELAESIGAQVLQWDAATGAVHERKRGWWPFRGRS